MGMSNYILDNEDKFWNLADETIINCEVFEQFVSAMKPQQDLLQGSPSMPENEVDFENMLSEAWSEKQSKYA
jgi:hypothetical protein